ncbi:hypothetical protein BD310DRAFT_815051, partial [Dichomitus squalens]
SNANFTAWEPLVTGGSWKKSPVTTTWEFLRIREPIWASLSNRSPSSIETAGEWVRRAIATIEENPTFVDDEDLGTQPAGGGFLVLLNSGNEIVHWFCANANTRKGMDGDSPDVACSDTYTKTSSIYQGRMIEGVYQWKR